MNKSVLYSTLISIALCSTQIQSMESLKALKRTVYHPRLYLIATGVGGTLAYQQHSDTISEQVKKQWQATAQNMSSFIEQYKPTSKPSNNE